MKIFVFSEDHLRAGQIAAQETVEHYGEDSADFFCVFDGGEDELRHFHTKLEIGVIDWLNLSDFGLKWRKNVYRYLTAESLVHLHEQIIPTNSFEGFGDYVCDRDYLTFRRFGLFFKAQIKRSQTFGLRVKCYLDPGMCYEIGEASHWGLKANQPLPNNDHLSRLALELTNKIVLDCKAGDMKRHIDLISEQLELAKNWLKHT